MRCILGWVSYVTFHMEICGLLGVSLLQLSSAERLRRLFPVNWIWKDKRPMAESSAPRRLSAAVQC